MKVFLQSLLLISLSFFGCSKKASDQPYNSVKDALNTVTINGTLYSTAVIAGKTWTTINYNGAGGVNYGDLPNSTVTGKYYTQAEAEAIKLPAGWRLPTKSDYDLLLSLIGDLADAQGIYYGNDNSTPNIIMSKTDWTYSEGTNSTGFNAFPAGYFTEKSGDALFMDQGLSGHFATSSNFAADVTENTGPVWMVIYQDQYTGTGSFYWSGALLSDRGSVRFVKDN